MTGRSERLYLSHHALAEEILKEKRRGRCGGGGWGRGAPRGTARLCVRRLRAGVHRKRQRNRCASVGDAALDLALHVVSKLAGAELGEIHAIGRAQSPCLPFVVRPLGRVTAGLVDEAVPNVDINDARLLGSAAVELVEVRRIRAGLGVAL